MRVLALSARQQQGPSPWPVSVDELQGPLEPRDTTRHGTWGGEAVNLCELARKIRGSLQANGLGAHPERRPQKPLPFPKAREMRRLVVTLVEPRGWDDGSWDVCFDVLERLRAEAKCICLSAGRSWGELAVTT